MVGAQKNRKRLIEGIAVKTNLSAVPAVQNAMAFVNSNTVGGTPSQTATKVATVKIPDSFPEIMAFLHIIMNASKTDSDIADEIITALWSTSLNWGVDEQTANRASVEAAWNSWGSSGGVKKNSKGEKLAFDPDIYATSAADKILLRSATGKTSGSVTIPITKAILITYIGAVKAATTGCAIAAAVEV